MTDLLERLYRSRFWVAIGSFIFLNVIDRQYVHAFICRDRSDPSVHFRAGEHEICGTHGGITLHSAWLVLFVVSLIAPIVIWIFLGRWHRQRSSNLT